MDIKFNKRWQLKTDANGKSHTLVKHYKIKKDDGSVNGMLIPATSVEGYYTRFTHLMNALLDELIKDSEAKTILELQEDIREFKKELADLVSLHKLLEKGYVL